MRIGELSSFAHNVSDSLASGLCSMVGFYSGVDIHGEAAASDAGYVSVDFLSGQTDGAPVSDALAHAVLRFSEMLPELAERHGIDISMVREFSARFGTDPVAGRHFLVTVESWDGHRSVDQYVGSPGRRYIRPRRSKSVA